MCRNEILQEGETIVLYYDSYWEGNIKGYGKLLRPVGKFQDSDYAECWIVTIPSGVNIQWFIRNPDTLGD